MSTFHLHNTLTRSLEEFQPLVPGTARMYTCGPTVYNFAHDRKNPPPKPSA
ncbi:MAG: hypothetical protein J6Y19_10670 [Kiritimatiellae bacterium]|nr:hypothetical protein [Kiritimatiellia bacterium]